MKIITCLRVAGSLGGWRLRNFRGIKTMEVVRMSFKSLGIMAVVVLVLICASNNVTFVKNIVG